MNSLRNTLSKMIIIAMYRIINNCTRIFNGFNIFTFTLRCINAYNMSDNKIYMSNITSLKIHDNENYEKFHFD